MLTAVLLLGGLGFLLIESFPWVMRHESTLPTLATTLDPQQNAVSGANSSLGAAQTPSQSPMSAPAPGGVLTPERWRRILHQFQNQLQLRHHQVQLQLRGLPRRRHRLQRQSRLHHRHQLQQQFPRRHRYRPRRHFLRRDRSPLLPRFPRRPQVLPRLVSRSSHSDSHCRLVGWDSFLNTFCQTRACTGQPATPKEISAQRFVIL